MTESETTKNTLYQLEEKMNREHWRDIQLFEDEDSRYSIAVGKAILLIKELEQYQAIGTVEGYERAIESSIENYNLYREYKTKVQEYSEIGTIEEFKALKEKNEPKKMLHNGVNWYRCPNGCEIHKKQFEKDWYCPKCGQKLDWKGGTTDEG